MGKGQLFVIGPPDDAYPKTNTHKPIAPRTGSVIENIRNPGISVIFFIYAMKKYVCNILYLIHKKTNTKLFFNITYLP